MSTNNLFITTINPSSEHKKSTKVLYSQVYGDDEESEGKSTTLNLNFLIEKEKANNSLIIKPKPLSSTRSNSLIHKITSKTKRDISEIRYVKNVFYGFIFREKYRQELRLKDLLERKAKLNKESQLAPLLKLKHSKKQAEKTLGFSDSAVVTKFSRKRTFSILNEDIKLRLSQAKIPSVFKEQNFTPKEMRSIAVELKSPNATSIKLPAKLFDDNYNPKILLKDVS